MFKKFHRNWSMLVAFSIAAMAAGCGEKDESQNSEDEDTSTACATGTVPMPDGSCQAVTSGDQPENGGGGGPINPVTDQAGGDEADPVASVALTFPNLSRKTYVDDEVSARTVSINFKGDKLECSKDGGVTFSSCASQTSLIWQPADFNALHVLRATATVGDKTVTEVASFSPQAQFPGLEIVSCTRTVTESSGFDLFVAAADLTTADQVVCLANGVVIEFDLMADSSSTMPFDADGIRIIAREGMPASFKTNAGNIFNTNGKDDLKLVGVNLEDTTGRTVLRIGNNGADRSENVALDGVTVYCFGNQTGNCIEIQSSGTADKPVRLHKTFAYRDNAGNGAALFVNDGKVSVEHSGFSGGYHAMVGYWGSVLDVRNSSFSSTAASASVSRGVILAYRDTEIVITGSTISSYGDHAFVLDQFNETTGTKLTLNGSLIRRSGSNAAADLAAIYLAAGAVDPVVHSTTNGNTFCNADPAVVGLFTSVFAASGASNSGSFSVAAQENGGVIGTCAE